jgi:hypothetical protein
MDRVARYRRHPATRTNAQEVTSSTRSGSSAQPRSWRVRSPQCLGLASAVGMAVYPSAAHQRSVECVGVVPKWWDAALTRPPSSRTRDTRR